jgi:hypothetical protein
MKIEDENDDDSDLRINREIRKLKLKIKKLDDKILAVEKLHGEAILLLKIERQSLLMELNGLRTALNRK